MIGWCVAAIALAGPTWKIEPSPFAEDAAPVMVLLKTGESMNLPNPSPNRMERARLKVVDFANEKPSQPVGLIAYAGSAHLVMPPTKDTGVIATMAAELSPGIMPKPGDDLVGAVELAEKTLEDRGGILLVVTDAIETAQLNALNERLKSARLVVLINAIADEDSVEMRSMETSASVLSASLTKLTPDSTDTDALIAAASRAGEFVAARGAGNRWSESGYWLVPLVAVISLMSFRRETKSVRGANE